MGARVKTKAQALNKGTSASRARPELVHTQDTVVEDVEEGFVDEGVEVEAQNDCVLVLGRDVAQDDLSEQLGHITLLPAL